MNQIKKIAILQKSQKLVSIIIRSQMIKQQQSKSNTWKDIQQRKFVQMMNSLTWYILGQQRHIRQNIKHQQNIFECLNSIEEKKLFQSIKQDNQQLRITAVVFILYLLYRNEKTLGLIMKRDGLDYKYGPTKYIIGGIGSYELDRMQSIKIMKQIQNIQHEQDALCWSLNLKTGKVNLLRFEELKQEKVSNIFLYNKQVIDPRFNIIGIFASISDPLSKSKLTIKSNMSQTSLKAGVLNKHSKGSF